jgi:hypothetical protein
MPSIALNRWQTDRMPRLDRVDAHCAALFGAPAPVPEMSEEALQGYVMLLSGHFQGFCRDLYQECARAFAAILAAELSSSLLAQFFAELKLYGGNPTLENIRKDFERFGFVLNLPVVDPANTMRITDIGHLNQWRNHAAHQNSNPLPVGVPPLSLAGVQRARNSCSGLAVSLDGVMYNELKRILRVPPW